MVTLFSAFDNQKHAAKYDKVACSKPYWRWWSFFCCVVCRRGFIYLSRCITCQIQMPCGCCTSVWACCLSRAVYWIHFFTLSWWKPFSIRGDFLSAWNASSVSIDNDHGKVNRVGDKTTFIIHILSLKSIPINFIINHEIKTPRIQIYIYLYI